MAELAVCLVDHGAGAAPARIAREVETRGLDGLFLPENSHVPCARRAPDKFSGDMRLLARFYDPFVALAACAAVTSRIRLGTSVCLLTQRDPLHAARACASLDQLSGGRLVLGVAGGFIREAMENHGAPFRARWHLVRERVAAMRSVWRDAAPRYRGELVELGPVCCGLPPAQAAGPPIWIGSNSARVPRRVAAYADGWLVRPALYAGDPFDDLARACDAHGRDAGELTLALMDAPREVDAAAAAIAQGYGMLVFFLRGDDAALLRELDRLALLAAALADAGAARASSR